MFCSNCGKEIEDNARFCRFCGQKLNETDEAGVIARQGIPEAAMIPETAPAHEEAPAGGMGTRSVPPADNRPEPAGNKRPETVSDTVVAKKKNSTGLVIAIAAVAVLLIAVGVLIFVMSDSPAKKYEEQLKLAERYLDELDYDKAIAAYRAAIDIDPKAEDAYLGLAEAYAENGDLQAAVDILKEGLEQTGSVAMEERLAELERQLAEQKAQEQAKLATPTPTPVPAGKGAVNWRGGDWTNRDDILPYKNEEGYIVFGAYEQDGDESNGPEPIEWEILEENGNGIFLVSRYVLDYQPYNREDTNVTWENCTLRGWLNDEFLNKAFTEREQARIRVTEVANPDNPLYGIPGGNSTRDRIFLLSAEEVLSHYSFNSLRDNHQMGYSQELIIPPTVYAKQQGVPGFVIDERLYNGTGFEGWGGLVSENYSSDCIGCEGACWWLRSPGNYSCSVCNVNEYGLAGWDNPHGVNYSAEGPRPALYIEP